MRRRALYHHDVHLSDGSVRKRRRSYNIPNQAHELTFSCFQGRPYLSSDRTRQWLIEALDRARQKHNLALLAYVVMPEHAHVLLFPHTQRYDIAEILKSIKQPVARRASIFLRKQHPSSLQRLQVTLPDGRSELRFWQRGGGYDRNIINDKTLHNSINYIHNNPVRRGLVEKPTDWAWSSALRQTGEETVKLAMDALPV